MLACRSPHCHRVYNFFVKFAALFVKTVRGLNLKDFVVCHIFNTDYV
jgi:hypothetical protein